MAFELQNDRIGKQWWVSLLLAFLATIGLFGGKVFGKKSELLALGAQAPEVLGAGQGGVPVRLSAQKGHYALVYFYPKDDTPGCTQEACALRDNFEAFEKAKVKIFGVSRDSTDSHEKFRKKYNLPFVLVDDRKGKVQAAFGVPSFLGMSARVSFLIDVNGKVVKVWPNVDPVLHAQEVLATVKQLTKP